MLAEEQPALQPLPLEPFRYYCFGVRTVHLDGYVEVDAAFYGAPPGWINRRVDGQWNGVRASTTSSIRPSLRKSWTVPGGRFKPRPVYRAFDFTTCDTQW
jgi:hypothetical protein